MAGPHLPDDLLIADNDAGSVVLRPRSGVYFELDRSATEVLRLAQSLGPSGAAVALAARYGQPVALVRADVDRVLGVISSAVVSSTTRARRPTRRGAWSVARGWWRLAFAMKLATVYATTLVVIVEVLLRSQPIDRASRWLGAPLFAGSDDVAFPPVDSSCFTDRERRVLGALAWVQRAWLLDPTCLRRALACGWALRHRQPRLCLGLTGSDEALAHAWLILEGRSLDGRAGASLFKRGERQAAPGEHG
ncbi:MAG: lasso peptide biosynthesis B2 protein [Acidimicrobiales bacterium]